MHIRVPASEPRPGANLAERQRGRVLLALVLMGVLLLASELKAEVRTIRGLSIAVDEIAPIDQKNTRISFEGRVFLVPNEQVDRTILEQALQSYTAAQKIAPSALLDFIRTALADGDEHAAMWGMQALVSQKKLSIEEARELIVRTAEFPALAAGLKNVVQNTALWSKIVPTIRAAIIVELGVADADWVRQSALGSALNIRDEVHRYASNAFSDAIKSRRFARLPLISSLMRDLFGVDDVQFQESRLVSDQLIKFHQALASRDINTIEITIVALKSNLQLKDAISSYLVEELHRAAREDIDSNNPASALELLSLIDLSFRTPTSHSLLKLALGRLSARDFSLLDRPLIKRFVLTMAQYDQVLQASLSELLEGQFRSAAREGNLTQADRALDTLVALRPDPNALNDELRIFYAFQLREHKHYPQSQVQLRNVRTGVPLSVRVRLFSLDALGISVWLLATVVVSGSVFLVLAVLRIMSIVRRLQRKPQKTSEYRGGDDGVDSDASDDDGEVYQGPVFRRMDGAKVSPERREYLQCLSVFNLDSKATFKQIRQAYRTAVKEHHPDRQAEGMASDRFVNLNQTYERIVELRAILGMDQEQ